MRQRAHALSPPGPPRRRARRGRRQPRRAEGGAERDRALAELDMGEVLLAAGAPGAARATCGRPWSARRRDPPGPRPAAAGGGAGRGGRRRRRRGGAGARAVRAGGPRRHARGPGPADRRGCRPRSPPPAATGRWRPGGSTRRWPAGTASPAGRQRATRSRRCWSTSAARPWPGLVEPDTSGAAAVAAGRRWGPGSRSRDRLRAGGDCSAPAIEVFKILHDPSRSPSGGRAWTASRRPGTGRSPATPASGPTSRTPPRWRTARCQLDRRRPMPRHRAHLVPALGHRPRVDAGPPRGGLRGRACGSSSPRGGRARSTPSGRGRRVPRGAGGAGRAGHAGRMTSDRPASLPIQGAVPMRMRYRAAGMSSTGRAAGRGFATPRCGWSRPRRCPRSTGRTPSGASPGSAAASSPWWGSSAR